MHITEFQKQVVEWADNTFGSDRPREGTLRHLVLEANEAKNSKEGSDNMREEYADVAIMLCNAAGRDGVDLEAEMHKKFEIVKNRKYARGEDGHIHRVRE